MSLLHPPKLLTAGAYARELATAIGEARQEVAIITTTLRANDERSQAIVDALCSAADRGVTVSVYADTITYLEPKEFLLRSPKRHPARAINAMKLEHKLKSHGIQFHWLGRKANIIITGRTHTKWAIVDDVVYSFGGVNLDSESFSNIDYMVRIHDARLSEILLAEHVRIRRSDKGGSGIRNHTIQLDSHTNVLLDGGLIGSSLIYRRACILALQATYITLVSQYCPTGPLNRILKLKHATLYYNHWRNASWANRVMISFGMVTSKFPTIYDHDTYLHAKFAIFTMSDGKKVAISGSHNFMHGSGIAGTREIAIETSDPRIIRQLERFYNTHVA